jgi:AcrR family transcriptional regulator
MVMSSSRTSAKAGLARSGRLAGAPPGPRQHDLRRGAILDAAAALFVEKGLAATSIDDIVVRAGVAKGTFYHYFQDRVGMLEALRNRYCQHFADVACAAMGNCCERDWAARLDAWTGSTVQEYLSSYPLHDAIFHDPAVCQRCVMGEEPIVRSLATLLRDGAEAGIWSVEDPVATAVFMFHGLHGFADEVIATGADTQSIAPRLTQLFRNLLRPCTAD